MRSKNRTAVYTLREGCGSTVVIPHVVDISQVDETLLTPCFTIQMSTGRYIVVEDKSAEKLEDWREELMLAIDEFHGFG